MRHRSDGSGYIRIVNFLLLLSVHTTCHRRCQAKVAVTAVVSGVLARQAYPEDSKSLYNGYRDATSQPHGNLILDFAQDTDDKIRFRTNVFPDEYPPIVYAPVNDETHKVQLP